MVLMAQMVGTIKQLRIKFFLFLLALFLLWVFCQKSQAACDYYVATNGNNGAAGTSIGTAWQTISYAESQMGAGDTVCIRGGTYNETITINISGNSGNTINFENYASETPLITGPASGTGSSLIISSNYVKLDGLTFKRRATGTGHSTKVVNVDLVRADHVEVANCEVYGNGAWTDWNSNNTAVHGIRISGSQYAYIHDNNIHDLSFNGIHIVDNGDLPKYFRIINNTIINLYANAITFNSYANEMEYGLIEGNLMGGSVTSDGFQSNDGSFSGVTEPPPVWGVWIRNNTFYGGTFGYNTAENSIDLKGARYFVVENNAIQGSTQDNDGGLIDANDRNGNLSLAYGTNSQTLDCVVRGNVFVDGGGGVLASNGYRVYNNTFINNDRDYTGPNSSYSPGYGSFSGTVAKWRGDVRIINNIYGGNKGCSVYYDPDNSSVHADYNLYLTDDTDPLLCYVISGGSAVPLSLSAFKSYVSGRSMTGKEVHSLTSSTHGFTTGNSASYGDPRNLDFTISGSSAAIDAGGAITTTTNSGSSSTNMTVGDGKSFSAGASSIGVPGDTLLIGGTTEVQIASISGNTLTLTASASWSNGAEVVWCKNGECPDDGSIDVGAYQADAGTGSVAVLSNPFPTGTVRLARSYTITVLTDVNASVRYSESPGTAYTSMTLFTSTGGTYHSFVYDASLLDTDDVVTLYLKAYSADEDYQIQFTLGDLPPFAGINVLNEDSFYYDTSCYGGVSGALSYTTNTYSDSYDGSISDPNGYMQISDPAGNACFLFDLGEVYEFSFAYAYGIPDDTNVTCDEVCVYFSNDSNVLADPETYFSDDPICFGCDTDSWQSANLGITENSRYVFVEMKGVSASDDIGLYELIVGGSPVEEPSPPENPPGTGQNPAKLGGNDIKFYDNFIEFE
jgi:hypothetical protein